VLPQARWVVRDLLPEGLTLLAGKPKQGKSWWAYDLCLAVVAALLVLVPSAADAVRHSVRRVRRGPVQSTSDDRSLQGSPAPPSTGTATSEDAVAPLTDNKVPTTTPAEDKSRSPPTRRKDPPWAHKPHQPHLPASKPDSEPDHAPQIQPSFGGHGPFGPRGTTSEHGNDEEDESMAEESGEEAADEEEAVEEDTFEN